MANYGGGEGGGSALRRSLLGGGQQRPRAGTIAWGGGSLTPEEIVARSNARGAPTSIEQFFANHPGVAAQFGHRVPQPGTSPRQPAPPGHPVVDPGFNIPPPTSGIPEGPPAGIAPGGGVGQGGADLVARLLQHAGPHAGLAAPLQRASLGQVSQRRIARRPLLQGHPAY